MQTRNLRLLRELRAIFYCFASEDKIEGGLSRWIMMEMFLICDNVSLKLSCDNVSLWRKSR